MSAKRTKLCSHIIKNDTGLAPNPFHRYCTSALCTPSHMRAKLKGGDWLIGISPKSDGHRLVYAMRISQVLEMDEYFKDERFAAKKPKQHGTTIEQCGDNIYYERGEKWKRLPSRFHNDPRDFEKDKGCPVFVSDHFYYFGDRRVTVPEDLKEVTQVVRGIRYKDYLVDQFVCGWRRTTSPAVSENHATCHWGGLVENSAIASWHRFGFGWDGWSDICGWQI